MKKILLLVFLLCLMHSGFSQDNFSVSGSKIYHPDGSEFIPVGGNVAGPEYSWGNRSLLPNSEMNMYTNIWNLNCMRVCWYMVRSTNQSGKPLYSNDPIDELVAAYTPLGVVVMIEAHDFTGGLFEEADDEDKAALKAKWVELATQFKDNPYVWFNIMNEPGGSSSSSYYQKWVDWHREIIEAIRATGNESIIVVDGMWWGQDAGHTYDDGNISDSESAILSHGLDILDSNDNIIFSFHAYSQWQGSVARVADYIDRVHAKEMALVCGEAGAGQEGSGSYGDKDSYRAGCDNVWNACKPRNVGMLAWHWQAGDDFNITNTGSGWGNNINSTTNPTNLTWYSGQHLWDVTHGGGWGLESTPLEPDEEAPTVPMNLEGSPQSTYVSLSWDASTDNRFVEGYEVYLNGVLNKTEASTSTMIHDLTPSTNYSISLKAYDSSGNRSAMSNIIEVTTLEASDCPKGNLLINGGFEDQPTGWTGEFWDAVNYFPQEGALHLTLKESGAEAFQTVSNLTPGGTYQLSGYIRNNESSSEPAAESMRLGVRTFGGDELYEELEGTSTGWNYFEINFTVGDSNTSADIFILNVGGHNWCYADNIELLCLNSGVGTSIGSTEATSDIQVWVNDSNLHIQNASGADVSVIGLNGKVELMRTSINNMEVINLNSLLKGVYIVNVVNDNTFYTTKIVY